MRSARLLEFVLASFLVVPLAMMGCQNGNPAAEQATVEDSAALQEASAAAEAPYKGGAQLWSENCMRCHNLRQPQERSDREWEAIVFQMRVRANLTAEEHRSILQFLKAAN